MSERQIGRVRRRGARRSREKASTLTADELRDRAVARLLRSRLDAEIAGGADPSSSRYLRRRAHELGGRASRDSLAHTLQEARRLSELPSDPRDPRVRPDSRSVRDARSQIRELEGLLRSPAPVYCSGIALALELITHGNSPLYVARRRGELRRGLERIVERLRRGP